MDKHTGIKNIVGGRGKINKPNEQKHITIFDDGEFLNIKLQKKFLTTSSSYDIHKLLLTAVSPLFLNQNKQPILPSISSKKSNSFKHIAFFIEFMPHYTGGRYSIYLQALVLSQYTKVSVVTTRRPVFYNDFKDYYNDNFSLIISNDYLMSIDNNNYDLVVGVPQISGQFASGYSDKWNIPLYMMIFESPNFVSEYRDGIDSHEDYWSNYKKCMRKAKKIIVPSYESKKYVEKWDKAFESIPIEVLYPCLNEVVANKVKKGEPQKNKRKSVVYLSRMTDFKNPLSIFRKLPKNIDIHIIGKIWKQQKDQLNKLINSENLNITIHTDVTDEEKFRLLRDCDLVIYPTKFEGFGMPPMEAFYFDKPIVTYDLPVLREIYKNLPIYVPIGEEHKFVHAVSQSLKDEQDKCVFFENRDILEFSTLRGCSDKILDIFEIPKVSAGIILYEGDEYLEYAVKALYKYLYQIIIVEGAVRGYSTKPQSSSKTYDILSKLKKSDITNKIVVVKKAEGKFWKDKVEKQNAIAKRVEGKYYIKIDDDEIWSEKSFLDVIDMFERDDEMWVVRMPFHHFWLSFENIAKDAGGKWSTKHPRVWRWKKGFKHNASFNYFQNSLENYEKVGYPYFKEVVYSGEPIFHFGYVKNIIFLMNKLDYYKNRGIEKGVHDTITGWKKLDDPTQPTQGSHVRSWAESFKGQFPKILDNHPYKQLKDIRIMED